MAHIPIPNNSTTQMDPFYRYKRNKLDIKKEGEFFVIKNINIIAPQIYSNVNDIIKYFSKFMGQKIIQDKITKHYKYKDASNSINCDNILEEYIKHFVICKKCNIPEYYNNKCNACGHTN